MTTFSIEVHAPVVGVVLIIKVKRMHMCVLQCTQSWSDLLQRLSLLYLAVASVSGRICWYRPTNVPRCCNDHRSKGWVCTTPACNTMLLAQCSNDCVNMWREGVDCNCCKHLTALDVIASYLYMACTMVAHPRRQAILAKGMSWPCTCAKMYFRWRNTR